MPRSRLLIFLAILLITTALEAQSILVPSIFSNRRMGYISDASAVAWNPAMLGVRTGDIDIMLGIQHDSLLQRLDGYSFFGKFGPIGIGYVTRDNALSPAQFYAGFGAPLSKANHLRLGVSAMYQSLPGGTIGDNLRGNISLMYTPFTMLYLSAGASNINRGPKDGIIVSGALAFTPLNWFGVHATVDKAMQSGYYKNDMDIQAGVTLSPWDNFVFSGMYNPGPPSFRVGVEWQIGYLGIGEIVHLNDGHISNGAILVRYSNADYFDLPRYADDESNPTSHYVDADCRDAAYKWMDSLSVDSPQRLLEKMTHASADYTAFYTRVRALSPEPSQLYNAIGEKYYGIVPTVLADSSVANPTIIRSVDGHAIFADSVIRGANDTTVICRVHDRNGHNVGNLTRASFTVSDSTRVITSVAQVAAHKKVAADFMILMDCSGSMSRYIAAVRSNVDNFARSLANRNIDFRIGGILYGEKIYDILQPTDSLGAFTTFYAKAAAIGGDEITSTAIMKAATEITYRPAAQKIAIAITDDCAVQDNADYSEPDLIDKLWTKGVRLYGVINPHNHNAGFTTRLTLGKEYDIKAPFNSVLDDISSEITTTYQVTYKSKAPVEIPKTFVRGFVRSENGWNLTAALETVTDSGVRQMYKTNPLTGEYEFEAPKGHSMAIQVTSADHMAESATLQIPKTQHNDTIVQTFVLKQPKTVLMGTVRDEANAPIAAKIRIEDGIALTLVKEIETNDKGEYSLEIPEGMMYRLTPSAKEHIPTTAEADMRTTKRGSVVKQDLVVTAITTAVERGLTFRLKNIFFDSGKWDLRSDSFEELNKLVAFMNEYLSIRIEIGAHTDNTGKDEANATLSQKRAQSVLEYLQTKGIGAARMVAIGYGKTVPVADNATPEGRQMNRRVEFKLIK